MPDGPWSGRSLSFVRQMLGSNERWINANEARKETLNDDELDLSVPPIGTVVWYSSEPHGNIALSVGGGEVLAVGVNGWPRVMPYNNERLGKFLGWTSRLGRKRVVA